MTTAVLIPTMRAAKIEPLIANLRETTACEVIWQTQTGSACWEVLSTLGEHVIGDDGGTWGARNNSMGTEALKSPKVTHLFLGADDIRFHGGWLQAALRADRRMGGGVVMVCDLIAAEGTLPLVSRRYIEEFGCTVDDSGLLIHEGYLHNFAERELVETAQMRGRYAYCPESVVEHLHWMAGKAERSDPVYELGERGWDRDIALFSKRRPMWGM